MDYLTRARNIEAELVGIRRDLHRHPELMFQEKRTAGIVAKHLRSLGIACREGVAKTGVVGELGTGGKLVALRADMDALPITEANEWEFKSENAGVMHACGHDAHTACLMGAARLLAEDFKGGKLKGRVRFIFQPAEERKDAEGKSGGLRMVEEGALEGVDGVIGMHVISTLPAGEVYVREGPMMAASDSFFGKVLGRGGHAASPHQAVDPIWLAAQVVVAIQGAVSRRKSPMEPGLITVASIHGGTTTNVIPSEVEMAGTIRTFSQETREVLHRELERGFSVARALGGDYSLEIHDGYPVLENNARMAAMMRTVAESVVGEGRVKHGDLTGGAEDFAYMARAAPGIFFNLGAKKDEADRPHHSPQFDIDEKVLPTGAALMAAAGHRFLEER